MVETKCLAAALAEEWEEVELVAVAELAVLADERGVVADPAVDFSHFEVACFWIGGRHGGLGVRNRPIYGGLVLDDLVIAARGLVSRRGSRGS